MPVAATWKPPKLVNGKFGTQADVDAFKAAVSNTGIDTSGGISGAKYDPQAMANANAAAEWGTANGLYQRPKGDSFLSGFVDAFLNPAVVAALTFGVGSAISGAGAAAGGAEGLTADQLLAQSAAGLSETGLADTAAQLGVGEVTALGTTAGATAEEIAAASDAGTLPPANAVAPQSAASVGGGSPGSTLLQAVKDYGGTALLLGGLLGGGASAPDMPNAPPPPDAPPDSQEARQPDEITRRKQAAGGSTDNTLLTGASGIDPFTLNLGRSKLLGQ